MKCHHKIAGIFFVLFAITMTSCENSQSSIPNMAVSLQLNLVGSDLSLNAIGAYKTYTTVTTATQAIGYGGVLVIHATDDSYYAFDLACPYEANDTIRVQVQSDITAKCPVCGSTYRILDGSGWRLNGPSTQKLKQYHVYPSGNYLYVTN